MVLRRFFSPCLPVNIYHMSSISYFAIIGIPLLMLVRPAHNVTAPSRRSTSLMGITVCSIWKVFKRLIACSMRMRALDSTTGAGAGQVRVFLCQTGFFLMLLQHLPVPLSLETSCQQEPHRHVQAFLKSQTLMPVSCLVSI